METRCECCNVEILRVGKRYNRNNKQKGSTLCINCKRKNKDKE